MAYDFYRLFGQIGYLRVSYYLMLAVLVIVYYIFPKTRRWWVLLAGSALFYVLLIPRIRQAVLFAVTIVVSWLAGLLLEHSRAGKLPAVTRSTKQRCLLALSIIVCALPLFLMDGRKLITSLPGVHWEAPEVIVPVGLSFYTLQIIAYLVDVSCGRIRAEHNFARYALFVSFFPQLLQGPIPRYQELQTQLVQGHDFDPDNIERGFQLILWGFFLKMMIADKAAVVVNNVFDGRRYYTGGYFLVGGILYSIQLYTDFQACTTLSQGAARLFGIQLTDNFNHPYFATSIKDFWRRWHMSLSLWLRDYIYIPLGGSRKGKRRKYINLLLTFLISGLWHGGTAKYVFWGLLHGMYQLIGGLTLPFRDKLYEKLGMGGISSGKRVIRTVLTFLLVTFAWIIFRADTLTIGLSMIRSIFTVDTPWILTGTYLFNMGLNQSEWTALLLSVLLLLLVGIRQEQGVVIGSRIRQAGGIPRSCLYILAICTIWIFGTYGTGFNAQDFIYRGF